MRESGVLHAAVEARVAFHDIDLAGIVWHGHYLKYLENARWALMERLGFGLDAMLRSGYGWPIIDVRLRYVKAARFDDRLQVQASLIAWQQKLTINYLLRDATTGERVARAQTDQACVEMQTGALQLVMPQFFLDLVDTALANEASARTASVQR
jgi:acyl-CoA thioester hydrolase